MSNRLIRLLTKSQVRDPPEIQTVQVSIHNIWFKEFKCCLSLFFVVVVRFIKNTTLSEVSVLPNHVSANITETRAKFFEMTFYTETLASKSFQKDHTTYLTHFLSLILIHSVIILCPLWRHRYIRINRTTSQTIDVNHTNPQLFPCFFFFFLFPKPAYRNNKSFKLYIIMTC